MIHTYHSPTTTGFVGNPKRFNVATTRAKSLMIVIGDPNVLVHDPNWLALLHYVRDNNGCAGSPMPELPPLTLPLSVQGAAISGADMGLQYMEGVQYDDGDVDPLVQGMQALSLLQGQLMFSEASAVEGVATRRHDA